MSLWLSHRGCTSLHQGFINMAQTQMLEEEAYYEVRKLSLYLFRSKRCAYQCIKQRTLHYCMHNVHLTVFITETSYQTPEPLESPDLEFTRGSLAESECQSIASEYQLKVWSNVD